MHKIKLFKLKPALILFIINLACFLNARAETGLSTGNESQSRSSAENLFNPLGDLSFLQLIEKLAGTAAKIGLPVAAMFIIYAGLQFVTARGSEDKIKAAKQTFTWTIIGTAILVGAWVIVKAIQGTVEALG